MTPLSPSTLEAIRTKDYPAIMVCLCDLRRGPEQEHLFQSYRKLRDLFTLDENIMESDSEILYDFRTRDIKPTRSR